MNRSNATAPRAQTAHCRRDAVHRRGAICHRYRVHILLPVITSAHLGRICAYLMLIAFIQAVSPPLSHADEGIDILFDGDKLISNPDREAKTGKPLILKGQVEKDVDRQTPSQGQPVKSSLTRPNWQFQPQVTLRGGIDTSAGVKIKPMHSLILQGEVSVNVPRTPDEVADYLRQMRRLIKTYESTAMADIFQGGSKVDMQKVDVAQVQGETKSLIDDIKSLVPPAELKQEHNQLASALANVGNLLVPSGEQLQNPLAILDKMAPEIQDLNKSMESYHQAALAVISQYQLPNSLDPLGGDRPSDDQLLQNAFADLSQQLLTKEKAAYSQQPGSLGGLDGQAALSNLLGSSAGDLQKVRQLLGGSGGTLSTFAKLIGSSGSSGGGDGDDGAAGMLRNLSAASQSGLNMNALQTVLQGLGGSTGGGTGTIGGALPGLSTGDLESNGLDATDGP